MNEEKKLNDATLEKVAGGMPGPEDFRAWTTAAEKTCHGCGKSDDECPYHRNMHTIFMTFGGNPCPSNSNG